MALENNQVLKILLVVSRKIKGKEIEIVISNSVFLARLFFIVIF